MKIKSVEVFLSRIPLNQPYTISYLSIAETEIIYFIVTLGNGIKGYGASNPFAEVTGESPDQVLLNLQEEFVQQLVGRDIDDYISIIAECAVQFLHFPGTLAAIDIALHDAYCNFYNKRVVDLFGQHITALPTSVTIGIKEKPAMLEDANNFYALGFRILKIKTGVDVEQDISRVAYLREHFGNKIQLRVDANAGYSISQLQKFLDSTSHLNIQLIEQPLAIGSAHLQSDLPQGVKNKLVADESLTDLSSAISLCDHPQTFGVFNIKLMKAGGILAAKKIADVAAQNHIQLFWGCNDESLISIAAALHIAYACANTKYLDLDGSFEVIETLIAGGFQIKNGEMIIVGERGLGVYKKQ